MDNTQIDIKRLGRMEEIANAIITEFLRKEINKGEGIGACLMILAKEAYQSEIAEDAMVLSLRSIIKMLQQIDEIERNQS